MSDWDGPATRYEITVLGDDDVLDELGAAIRSWALPRGRRFFIWRKLPEQVVERLDHPGDRANLRRAAVPK